MPLATIEVRTARPPLEEIALIDELHKALASAFRIPERDKHIRLIVHEPHRFAVPQHLAKPELKTIVTIDCFAGRSIDAKRALYREIVGRFGALGIPADHITIVLHDVPLSDWGVSGGRAACDIDLGFAIEV